MSKLVSIIVPVYNAEKYLEDCIRSILTQSYRTLEIIAVNDGSKDSSLSILHKWAEQDDRIIVIDQPNQGVSSARNRGLDAAKGDYITFIDSDDWYEPDTIKQLVAAAEENCAEMIMANDLYYNDVPSKDREKLKETQYPKVMREFLMLKTSISSWRTLYAEALLRDQRFHTQIHFHEDTLFQIETLCKHPRIAISEYRGYHYRIGESATHRFFNEKTMTTIDAVEWIDRLSLQETKEIREAMHYKMACMLVAIMYVAAQDPDHDKALDRVFAIRIRRLIKKVIGCRSLSWKQRIKLLLACISPRLVYKLIH